MAQRKFSLDDFGGGFLVSLLVSGIIGFGIICGCTVTPSAIPPPAAPAFSGNSQDGGVIDLGPGNKGPAHVDSGWVSDYAFLAKKYGKDITPPCRAGDGLTLRPDGTYSVDFEHLADKNTMARMQDSGFPP